MILSFFFVSLAVLTNYSQFCSWGQWQCCTVLGSEPRPVLSPYTPRTALVVLTPTLAFLIIPPCCILHTVAPE